MNDIKNAVVLLVTNFCLILCIVGLKDLIMQVNQKNEQEMIFQKFVLENESVNLEYEKESGAVKTVASGQRVIDYTIMEIEPMLSDEEYQTLLRIVEAEAGGEDMEGKMLVANVVLNRVESDKFPDNVVDVVYQKSKGVTQFQPVSNGRIEQVTVSQDTKDAVKKVLDGEDESAGALYFAARKSADPERMKWFDENLTFLFTHGGHEFFR